MIEPALRKLFSVIGEEAAQNPAFARKLEDALGQFAERYVEDRRVERVVGGFHPFVEYRKSTPEAFRERLSKFDKQELKLIVAKHGIDIQPPVTSNTTKAKLVEGVFAAAAKRAERDKKLFEY